MQYWVDGFRRMIGVPEASSDVRGGSINSVLFGGAIGSLFSLLQFVSSTLFGAISDIYGRKSVLILALVSYSAQLSLA
jgi:MFS family permease